MDIGTGSTTTGAVMSFFDNYGIIGTRIVAPVGGGNYAYKLAGQDGALAGQQALTIGSRPAKRGDGHGTTNRDRCVLKFHAGEQGERILFVWLLPIVGGCRYPERQI